MGFDFKPTEPPPWATASDWSSWNWQAKNSLSKLSGFERYFELSQDEREAFAKLEDIFRVRVTPYYAKLAGAADLDDPIRKMLMPSLAEAGKQQQQQMFDPLGERSNSPVGRIIHRYPDRCLLLVTDFCSVYCRYCTRKHFTAGDQVFPKQDELDQALGYINAHKQIREVILSGGDPLTLSDGQLLKVIEQVRAIPHVELIRIGSRIPVVAPMRVSAELVENLKAFHPIYIMTHFNHPKELTQEAAESLRLFVDAGFPVFNQMVLLNGVNNHEVIVQALSRRLLYLRVKPYYMFQCDPSQGTDHLRTSIEDSERIQKALWGRVSGLMMPNLSLDIPGGGGKVGLIPNFETDRNESSRTYEGWDGVSGEYLSPTAVQTPDISEYEDEWL